MIKLALTLKESVLFKDLSVVGNLRPYFCRTLDIDYELPEMLYFDGAMYWNYENDVAYNCALLKKRDLNEAVQFFLKRLARVTANLESVADQIITSPRWNKFPEAKRNFRRYIEAYLQNMPFLYGFWNIENLLFGQLQRDFANLFGSEEGLKALQSLTFPSRLTYFSQEQQSLDRIIRASARAKIKPTKKEIEKYPVLRTMIERHIKNFGFTTTAVHLGRPMNFSDVLKRIIAKSAQRQPKAQNQERRTAVITKELQFYPEIYQRVKLAQDLTFWKNHRLDIMFKCDFLVKPMFRAIARSMGLTYSQFVFLRIKEIEKWLEQGKKVVNKREIMRRQKHFVIHLKDGNIYFTSDPRKFPAQPVEVISDIQEDTLLLKGQTAYPGKVIGRVKIVHQAKHYKKIQKGDILVTTMTRPEMMIVLEKAAAFITDEGGILSHAAIVSRELKKPCLIGTKIATKVLKDGDMVEVDANRGIVKILRRK